MRGPENFRSLLERNLFYPYEGMHLVARIHHNAGVRKKGSPKRSVYSEIDDFGAFVRFPPFGGQK